MTESLMPTKIRIWGSRGMAMSDVDGVEEEQRHAAGGEGHDVGSGSLPFRRHYRLLQVVHGIEAQRAHPMVEGISGSCHDRTLAQLDGAEARHLLRDLDVRRLVVAVERGGVLRRVVQRDDASH